MTPQIAYRPNNYSASDYSWRDDIFRDRPMGYGWRLKNKEKLSINIPKMKSKTTQFVLESILADAIQSIKSHDKRRISYSRSKEWWAKAVRYAGKNFTHRAVTSSVDTLVEFGLLVDHEKSLPGSRGLQSSYAPADILKSLPMPDFDEISEESIVLRSKDGTMLEYRDTRATISMRKKLSKINKVILRTAISLNVDGVLDTEECFDFENKTYKKLKLLRRIFNGSFKDGGRYYGGFWENIPKGLRDGILIDGEPTIEIDYSQIHPRILYGMVNSSIYEDSTFDAYTIEGWDRNTICKQAFNILINAPTFLSALGAIQNLVGEKDEALRLMNAIKGKHPEISSFFHSGAGLKLQNIDAKVATIVMHEMTIKKGITVLPVHDSFIVKEEFKDLLTTVMKNAFKEITKMKSPFKKPNFAVKENIIKSTGSIYNVPTLMDPPPSLPSRPSPFSPPSIDSRKGKDSSLTVVKNSKENIFVGNNLNTLKPIPMPSFLNRKEDTDKTAPITRQTPSDLKRARQSSYLTK